MGIALGFKKPLTPVEVSTADLIFPDARAESPELYYPSRKPTGKVRINWSHPLTEGLYAYAMLGENVDLVDGQAVVLKDVLTNTWESKPAEGGMSANMVEQVSNGATIQFNKPICGDKLDVSFLVRLKHDVTTAGYAGLFNGSYANNGYRCLIGDTGSNYMIRPQAYGAGVISARDLYTSIPLNTLITFLVTYKSTGEIDVYSHDGREVHGGTPITFVPFARTKLFGAWNDNLQGSIYLVARFDGEMSPEKARELVKNPYQFLIEA